MTSSITSSIADVVRTRFGVGVTFTPGEPWDPISKYKVATEDGFVFEDAIGIAETPWQYIQRAEQAYLNWRNDTWRLLQEANGV